MQVIINRNALLEVLGAATGVVGSRTPKDILKFVRLTATDDGLLLGATDLEVGLRGAIRQVEIKKAGDSLVPADKLMQIARESVDETLTLDDDGERCHIRGADSHFEMYGRDPGEFPPIPDLEGEPDVEIDAAELRRMIDQTIFAVAKENTRYAINGVLWEKKGKKLCLVATDGRRLAWGMSTVEKSAGENRNAIVPAKTVSVLQRVLAHVEGPVAIQFTENQILVRAGAFVISSALVEGHFPPYEEVIPKDNDKKIELNSEELLSAVRRAALLTNEQSKGVRLHFADGRLVLSSRAPEQGEATVSMTAPYTGAALEIGFNPLFLTDALRVAGAPVVTLEIKDASRPGVFRSGSGFVYLVMPVSLV